MVSAVSGPPEKLSSFSHCVLSLGNDTPVCNLPGFPGASRLPLPCTGTGPVGQLYLLEISFLPKTAASCRVSTAFFHPPALSRISQPSCHLTALKVFEHSYHHVCPLPHIVPSFFFFWLNVLRSKQTHVQFFLLTCLFKGKGNITGTTVVTLNPSTSAH